MTWKVLGALGAAAVVVTGLSLARPAKSADHRDAPGTKAEPAADINDVYTWMDATSGNYVMAMTVFPFADSTSKFSENVQYIFHTTSGTKFGESVATSNVICTFDTAQVASCWVGADDFVTGDASGESGITSAAGKTKVFAGRRSDPFFFNLTGFNDAVAAVVAGASSLKFDDAGCPTVDGITATALAGKLKETASTADPTRAVTDDFVTAQGLVLVVSVDKSLVTKGGSFVSVWASTNSK